MKAIVLREPGPIDNLIVRELPLPELRDNEVLIAVKAISINPVDVKTRNGNGVFKNPDFSKQMPLIIGWDISGTVTDSRSAFFKAGDEVFGMVNFPGAGRAYAEYVAAPADHLTHKPDHISHPEAAAATLAPLTALQVLTQAEIKKGDRVLIHAGSGGVGHYAVQIAKYYGAYVIATSSAANKDFILSLGADEHVDYTIQKLQDATHSIDFVLDTLGIESILNSLDIIKNGGKIISIVSQFNDEIKEKAKIKNIAGGFYLVHSNGKDMKLIADLMKSGDIKSHVSKIYPFEQMSAAHLQVETGRTVGKVVISL
jgi:NADPH:quinone reductase-like Zn-dependent oxidoreductase